MNLLRVTIFALTAVGISGCKVAQPEDIRGQDSPVLIARGRLSWVLLPEKSGTEPSTGENDGVIRPERGSWARPAAASAPGPHATLALDASFRTTSGSSKQQLQGGEFLEHDGERFDGPGRLEAGYDLYSGTLGVRGGIAWPIGFRLEGVGGFGVEHLDLRVRAVRGFGIFDAHEDSTAFGVFIGVSPAWQVLSWLEVYGEAATFQGFAEEGHPNSSTLEAGLGFIVLPHVTVKTGWGGWFYKRQGLSDSDVRLNLSGPVVGLEVSF